MKKVLLVLGLALCGTFAFAQTAKTVGSEKLSLDALQNAPVRIQNQSAAEQVDYKSSIFVKEVSVVKSFQFDADSMSGISYGDNAVVGANDPALFGGSHQMDNPKSVWIRIDSVNYMLSTEFNSLYNQMCAANFIGLRNNIIRYMDTAYGDHQNNGFMMISNIDAAGINNVQGINTRLNAYVAFPSVTLPNTCVMPMVEFFQFYRKYYDNCYIDYKVNGAWQTTEINVTGVDLDVNTNLVGYYQVILPHAVATQHSLEFRIRAYYDGDGAAAAGYVWAFDNVNVLSNDAQYDWSFNGQGYLDGFYGLIPPDFNIPMGYVVNARNVSINSIGNMNLSVNHRYMDGGEWQDNNDFNFSTPQTRLQNQTLPAGDVYRDYVLSINERGFMVDTLGLHGTARGHGDTSEAYYQCNPERYDTNVYGVTDPDYLPNTYSYVGLPTDHQGKNQFTIVASGNNMQDTVLDRMTYTVSRWVEATPANQARGITVPGYRWGFDNGVISTGSEFAYQFTSDGYVAEEGDDQWYPGYEVFVRFNMPSEVPVDPITGEEMVIRGIELIPTSTLTAEAMNNALVTPVCYVHTIGGSGWGIYGFPNYTGLSDRHTETVNGSWFDSRDSMGYKLPENNYNAVNILFPNQPEIWPNYSFYFGYKYAGGNGAFSLGTQQTYFRVNSDSSARYRDEPALADYANQFWPTNKVYDAYAHDDLNLGRSGYGNISGYNITEYPLIRLIVGPAMEIDRATVSAECNDDESDTVNRYWIARSRDNMCIYGNDTVAEGSSIGYDVYPGDPSEIENGDWVYDNHNVIEHIWVKHNEGEWEEYDLNDESRVEAHEFNVIEPDSSWWDPMLVRSYYTVYLENMTGHYTIKAQAGWRPLGVSSPVETQVNLGLAPNPATSQVRVNVTGVTGKVNCNILDMSGRVIYSADFNAENEQTINLSGVPAGAYFVRVTGDTFSKVERLIVR